MDNKIIKDKIEMSEQEKAAAKRIREQMQPTPLQQATLAALKDLKELSKTYDDFVHTYHHIGQDQAKRIAKIIDKWGEVLINLTESNRTRITALQQQINMLESSVIDLEEKGKDPKDGEDGKGQQ